MRRVKFIKGLAQPVHELAREVEELAVLDELAEEEDDEETRREVAERTDDVAERLERLEFKRMLAEPEDAGSAFLSVHAGAGGTESCDWAAMLLRMYLHWAEREGYQTEVVDTRPGEEAGVRSATVHVQGDWAFGYLKSEIGVHRLVRISPFDASGRRHTSFAAVDVVPEIEDQIEVELNDSEIEMEFLRSSGPGGQHVNKVSSAVRLRHVPTGITVLCQSERSQHKNRAIARKLLQAKLYQREKQKRQKEMEKLFDEKGEIAWGNQIRSYVLQPYQMVKDLRTELKTGNPAAVLDGELTAFMEAYLRYRMEQRAGARAAED
ncbi:MAG: peptide chain release factor 2 [Planctomycetes bacterium SM23_32]|nr:MAG: peptide chain release factor 2 [Planctomycetes bacterium SM23_32]